MRLSNIGVAPLFSMVIVLTIVLVVVLVVKLPRQLPLRITSSDAEVFAQQQQIGLSPDNQAYVRWYLTASRRFRILGTFAGLLVGIVVSEAGQSSAVLLSSNWFFTAIAGYFVGALVGAWKSGVAPAGSARSASLTVRQRGDFVPNWMPQVTYVAAAGSLVFLVASLFEGSGVPTAGVRERTLIGVAALFGSVAADLGTRRLARAGRPSAAEDVMAAFDAIVRVSSSAIATAGLSLCLWLLSWSAFAARPNTGQDVFSLACVLVGTVMLFASVTVWVKSRHGEWRRSPALRP
ncbi:hypothetical protein GALL_391650 [mine drainage metagenome]|uniref:Uncharacterized protein n=1 Tax=mine drainage metagenome TaxID=410659 RepID=A0A1J5QGH2_9ZZZZ